MNDTVTALFAADPGKLPSSRSFIARRPALTALVGLAFATLAPHAAQAAYPDKPIRLVVPFAPGGGTDTISRILADEMSKDLGQNVIVDNRPGAGTIIGTGVVAGSEPDGYTLLMATPAFAVNPSLNAKMPFDTFKDLAPVALVARSFNVLVVNKDVPINSVSELIAYAKEHPDELDYGSFGNGTSAHLAGALFNALAGTSLTHVPHKGAAPAITDLIGGQIEVMFTTVASVSGHIASGSVRPLAVTRPNARRPSRTCQRWPRRGCRATSRTAGTRSTRPPARRPRSSPGSTLPSPRRPRQTPSRSSRRPRA